MPSERTWYAKNDERQTVRSRTFLIEKIFQVFKVRQISRANQSISEHRVRLLGIHHEETANYSQRYYKTTQNEQNCALTCQC